MKFRLLLPVLLSFLLLACDSPEQTGTDTQPSTATEAATEATPAEESVEDLEALTAEATAEVEETNIDAVAEEETIVLSNNNSAAAKPDSDWQYQEGSHFRRMTSSQGTSSAPDKIEVAEVFWYGCPHCYDFDPVLREWEKGIASDVTFVRIPVIWNPTNQVHARVMYTAEALGILDEAHTDIFKAIHQQGNMLTKEPELIEFFAGYGVSEAEFKEAFNSFGVSSAVKRAENLTRRYGIKSVPVIVVNGKYASDAPEVRSFNDMINVTNELVEREREDR
jgi:thiol:disulfide interchange protein DsbA